MRPSARLLIVCLLAVGAILGVPLTAGLPLAQAAETTAPAQSAARMDPVAADPNAPTVSISVAHKAALKRDTNLTLSITITAPQSAAIDGVPLVLSMRRSLITQTDDVTGWIASTSTDRTTELATSAPLQLAAGAQTTTTMQVPAAQIPTWRFRTQHGALGFEIRVGTGGPRTPFLTSWNVSSGDVRSVRMVFPLTTPAGTSDSISASDLATLTAANGALTTELDTLDTQPVLIAVDPRIPASIEALGQNAPKSAVAWLDRLKAQSHVVPLLYGDADPNTLAGLGATTLPDANVSSLLSWDRTDLAVVRHLTPAGGKLLQNSGYRSVIVDSDSVTASSTAQQTTSLRSGELQLLTSSSLLSRALEQVTSATSTQQQADRIATVGGLALLTSLANSEVPSVTVLAPSSWTHHLAAYQALFTGTRGALSVKWSGSVSPFSATHSTNTRLSAESPVATAGSPLLQSLLASLGTVDTFAKATVDGSPQISANRSVLTLLSFGWKTDSASRQAAISRAVTANTAYSSALSFSSNTNLTLVSGNSTIPVPIRNDSSWPVLVSVQTKPSNGRAKVSSQVQVRIDPHATETAKVPVTAVANGTVKLSFHLLSSDGTELAQPITREMTIRANWEGWGVTVIAILIGGFFLVGLYRSFRRHQRLRAEAAAARAAQQPPDSPTPPDVSRETSGDRNHLPD